MKFKSSNILILITLLAAGIFFYLRAHYRVPVQDEVVYSYVLDTDHYKGYWEPGALKTRIETFGDVVSSQVNHYIYLNGRSLVHTVEQTFSGVIDRNVYFVLASLMAILLIACVIRLFAVKASRSNPLLWMLTVILVFYGFIWPSRLLLSINLGCNYLIPSLLMTLTLMAMRWLGRDGVQVKWYTLVAASLIALATGWSHEGFCIPLSATVAVYYLVNFSKFRRYGWCVAIPLFVGTLILMASPGNWDRSEANPHLTFPIIDSLSKILSWPMTWALIIALVTCILSKSVSVGNYLRQRWPILLFMAVTLLFLCYVGGGIYSYVPFGLAELYLTVGLVSRLAWMQTTGRATIAVTASLLALFIAHQTVVTRYVKEQGDYQREMLERYLASDDGQVVYNPPTVPWYAKPFVCIWPMFGWSELDVFSEALTHSEKPFSVLYPAEYEYVYNTPPTPGFTNLGRWWLSDSAMVPEGQRFELEYYPVDFSHDAPFYLKVKFALSPDAYPSTEPARVDTLRVGGRTLLRVESPTIRKIKSINPIK